MKVAQFTVRNLEDDVLEKLHELARRQGKSLDETVCDILRREVMRLEEPGKQLGSRIAARFASLGLDDDLPELRS